jgi:biotin transport system permease protein
MMEPLYRDGDTPLHRLPAWLKLAVLVAAGVVLFAVHDPRWLLAACGAGAALLVLARAGFGFVWRHARGLLLILAVLAAFTAYFNGWLHAVEVVARVIALAALALAVTVSTRSSDLVAVCERALRPLEALRLLDAGRVALALALALRFVPELWRNYQEIREAQAARGLAANPLALAVPLIVRTLARAEEVADAIDARGVDFHSARRS